jgi:hypothetical protein
MRGKRFLSVCSVFVIGFIGSGRSEARESTREDIDALKKELAELRKTADRNTPIPPGSTSRIIENRYGPNAPVTTRSGKLTLGGLLQVWYYAPQKDTNALFASQSTGIADTNEAVNNTFRIRRAELTTVLDIHENVTGYVMVDFAREINGFPAVPTSQGLKTANNLSPEFAAANGVPGSTGAIAAVQHGSGSVPNLLQDALINYHGLIPHHDFTVGQYLTTFSQEDFWPNGMLDFVERSFIGNIFARESGLTVHGTWWDSGNGKYAGPYCGAGSPGRVQYWLSVFDGAGNYLQTGGQSQNRADDNNDKDLLGTLMIRPVWKQETWGSLDLGASGGFGRHGGAGGPDPIANPVNGLNRQEVFAHRLASWARYEPGGPVKGLWLKGEASWIKDRNAPNTVIDLLGNDADGTGFQTNPRPQSVFGFYSSIGYKLGESIWAGNCGDAWWKPLEFCFRYEQFDNLYIADLVRNSGTNVYETKVATPGINYYIKGHNAKLQLNYNFVRNPEGPAAAKFHNVKGDNFVMNFQVMF